MSVSARRPLRRTSSEPHIRRNGIRLLFSEAKERIKSLRRPFAYREMPPLPEEDKSTVNGGKQSDNSDEIHDAVKKMSLPYARRNRTLKFVEVDIDGNSSERFLTRQQILAEVRQNWYVSEREASHRIPIRSPRHEKQKDMERGILPRNKKNTRGNVRRPRLSVPGERPRRKETRVACNRLTVRDMRQIDPSFTATPAIWVREDALVVSLENVRAIILHDRMFVFDPENGSSRRSIWYTHKRMGNTLEDIFLPFEFRALEGILLHACMELERDFFAIEPQLIRTLGDLPRKITNEQLERLRLLEQRLNTYYSRARRVQQALQNVLDEDEDMADMYLTEKRKNPNACRNPIDHDEAEMLLETYLQNVDDLTNKAELLNRAIDDTENLMEIHLDTMQNKLLLIDLFITGLTTVFGFATMATAIFGMNFPFPDTFSELPRSQYYFASIVAVIFVIMALGLGIIVAWVKRQGIYSGKVTAKLGRKPDKPEHMAAAVKKSEDARRAAVELLSGQNGIRGNSIDGYVDAVSRRSSMERFVDAV